ncbi:deoxyribodipyrimidine photolyase [Sphingobacterium phlebotomi]|uniref:Deoxyribodipyrimidine photolyase n=1 Tax=Sphingobacterium phlebotomi TaxID=2605433 RepID=A0A5D4GXH0_9SPHI|nr:deoxyribodipyrimidine photo-lyase [Sphingobacterium phlebotomi]TYR32957.1 deoxyribodipyrimidine photolyase [Sphingobacterium phlebotomi]
MTKKVILVWFRNDLRVHDNEILHEAVQKGDIVIPVYFFDPRYFRTNDLKFQNTGIIRAKFLLDTVAHFKYTLQEIGADLLVFHEKPEDVMGTLCAKYEVTEVYHHREVAQRETSISERVEEALWKEKINLKHFIGHTLYHKEDLPIPIRDIPDSFNSFKKKVEKESFVRPVLPAVTHITTHPHLEATHIPTLEALGFPQEVLASLDDIEVPLQGGEGKALEMIEMTLSADYNDINDYNLVSPYIATGAVSPALYYHKIKAFYDPSNKKKYDRLLMRLLWRDYFRFMLKKYPNIFFKPSYSDKSTLVTSGDDLRVLMRSGRHHPVIDELIHDLQTTGNLPYEYRDILAAYMLQEWDVSHLTGASFFEEYLLDYAPATTYGYWLHFAGSGTSPKDNLKISWEELLKKNYQTKKVVK